VPYIKRELRAQFDGEINALANRIKRASELEGYDGAFAGFLDYCIFTLGAKVMPARRYWAMCMIVGVFRNAADEFLRRVVDKYEDEKLIENGDVLSDEILGK
jgi:hypothetical protein